jgi:hypothetical protein
MVGWRDWGEGKLANGGSGEKDKEETEKNEAETVTDCGACRDCRVVQAHKFFPRFAVVHPLRTAYRLHKSAACESMGEDMLPSFEGMRDKVHTSSRIQVPEEDQPEKLHVPRRIRRQSLPRFWPIWDRSHAHPEWVD